MSGGNIYEVATGQVRFTVESDFAMFSPDGSLLLVSGDGMYEVATGIRRLTTQGFPLQPFSVDRTLLAVNSAALGNPCIILGPSDYPWPRRSGLVASTRSMVIRAEPSASSSTLAETDYQGELIVSARTTDSQWFKVWGRDAAEGWVAAEDVTVILMPEDLLIEDLSDS